MKTTQFNLLFEPTSFRMNRRSVVFYDAHKLMLIISKSFGPCFEISWSASLTNTLQTGSDQSAASEVSLLRQQHLCARVKRNMGREKSVLSINKFKTIICLCFLLLFFILLFIFCFLFSLPHIVEQIFFFHKNFQEPSFLLTKISGIILHVVKTTVSVDTIC